jgi:putative SOS response-associated peptidase YedK
MLDCYPADEMAAEPVSTHVNNVRNNDAECVTPLVLDQSN